MLLLLLTTALASPAPPEEADEELIITASRTEQARSEATVAVEVLDRQDIEDSGARTLDELLRSIPGLEVVPSLGGVALRMRGLDARHLVLMVDGQPLIGRVDGTLDISRLRLLDIERIEISRGPGSALHGADALAGVIHVVTRRPSERWRAQAQARRGSHSTGDLGITLSTHKNRLGLRASGGLFGTEGYDLDPDTLATTADAVEGGELGLGAELELSARAGLSAQGSYQQRDTRGIDESATGATFDRRVLEETASTTASAGLRLGERVALRASVAPSLWRQQYLSDQRGSDVQDSYADTSERRLRAELGQSLVAGRRGRHLLVAGLDAERGWMRSERIADGQARRDRLALYAQDDWTLARAPRVSLAPGARIDLDEQFGLQPAGRLALRLDPLESLGLRVSVGTAWRAPDFKQLYLSFDHSAYGYVVEGNPDLSPESSLGLTAGADWAVGEVLDLRLSGWHDQLEELIDIGLVEEGGASSVALYRYRNIGRARSSGVELGGELRVGRSHLSLGYTRTQAFDLDTGRRLDGRPPDRLAATLGARWGGLLVDLRGDHSGPRPFSTEDESGVLQTNWSSSVTWLNLRLAVELSPHLSLETGASNLLDQREDLYLGLAPRTLFLGLVAQASAPTPHAKSEP